MVLCNNKSSVKSLFFFGPSSGRLNKEVPTMQVTAGRSGKCPMHVWEVHTDVGDRLRPSDQTLQGYFCYR